VASLRGPAGTTREHAVRLALAHAGDHLRHLLSDAERAPGAATLAADPTLAREAGRVADLLDALAAPLRADARVPELALAEATAAAVAQARLDHRHATLQRTASGAVEPSAAVRAIEGMRRVDSVAHHAWRAAAHVAGGEGDATG
jgi:phosphate:Na+ symporter